MLKDSGWVKSVENFKTSELIKIKFYAESWWLYEFEKNGNLLVTTHDFVVKKIVILINRFSQGYKASKKKNNLKLSTELLLKSYC